jgi:hypothetical protein
VVGKLYGKLNETISFVDSKKKESVIYDFSKIVKDPILVGNVKDMLENESRRVWDPVTQQIYMGNGEKATEEKLRIEAEQRKKREETIHKTKYFEEKNKNWNFKQE